MADVCARRPMSDCTRAPPLLQKLDGVDIAGLCYRISQTWGEKEGSCKGKPSQSGCSALMYGCTAQMVVPP